MSKTITVTIPTADEERVLDNFALGLGYTGTDVDGYAQTKEEFLALKVQDFITESVQTGEMSSEVAEAKAAVKAAKNALLAAETGENLDPLEIEVEVE